MLFRSNVKNLLLRPIPEGNFELETRLKFKPAENQQIAGLLIYENAANHIQLGYGLCDAPQCRLNPVNETKKRKPHWSTEQAPGFIRCLSCFQLYPLIVIKVNVFVNELLGFFKGGLFELS